MPPQLITDLYYFRVKGVVLLAATLVFCFIASPAAAEEAVLTEKKSPCRGLKPFNNLDELLYQFYINLDSECLFETSAAELEKAWDIKILSYKRTEEYSIKDLIELGEKKNGLDFEGKPYVSEKDAFYLAMEPSEYSNRFTITITKAFYQKHFTLFPGGSFPRTLPEPYRKCSSWPNCVYKWQGSGVTKHTIWFMRHSSVLTVTIQ